MRSSPRSQSIPGNDRTVAATAPTADRRSEIDDYHDTQAPGGLICRERQDFRCKDGGEMLILTIRLRAPRSPAGVLAQLVERLNGIEEVRGSNPLGSTPRKLLKSSSLQNIARSDWSHFAGHTISFLPPKIALNPFSRRARLMTLLAIEMTRSRRQAAKPVRNSW